MRFFDPQGGVIKVGGGEIDRLSLPQLYGLFSVVSQETYLFDDTIEANLRLAKPGASLDDIKAAARAAQLDGFIIGIPKGSATRVGERGTELSGGQRQRISLARALLKNAPILLLDEVTYMSRKGEGRLTRYLLFTEDGGGGLWTTDTIETRGHAGLRAHGEWSLKCLPDLEWTIVEIFDTQDPDRFWVECDGEGRSSCLDMHPAMTPTNSYTRFASTMERFGKTESS